MMFFDTIEAWIIDHLGWLMTITLVVVFALLGAAVYLDLKDYQDHPSSEWQYVDDGYVIMGKTILRRHHWVHK